MFMNQTGHGWISVCQKDWNGRGRIGKNNMSFNQKIIYTSFFIIALVLGFGALYYKKTHTYKYIPLPPRPEVTLTIIPGWNLRQVAEYLVKQGFATNTDDVYELVGKPAVDHRKLGISLPIINESSVVSYKPGYVS